jgi:hypothetical protein
MFDVRLPNPFQADGLDALRQAQEGGLHIFRHRGDLAINAGPQGFDGPHHRGPEMIGLAGGFC